MFKSSQEKKEVEALIAQLETSVRSFRVAKEDYIIRREKIDNQPDRINKAELNKLLHELINSSNYAEKMGVVNKINQLVYKNESAKDIQKE